MKKLIIYLFAIAFNVVSVSAQTIQDAKTPTLAESELAAFPNSIRSRRAAACVCGICEVFEPVRQAFAPF